MTRYASETTVSADRSRGEIEWLLKKYGASGFGYMWKGTSAVIMFEMQDRRIRFTLPLPEKTDPKYLKTPGGRTRHKVSPDRLDDLWEQDCRVSWRALTLCIKAKLESVASKIESFEEAWLSHVVLPDGRTVSEAVQPQIDSAYKTGKMPPLLLGAASEQRPSA